MDQGLEDKGALKEGKPVADLPLDAIIPGLKLLGPHN